MKQLRRLISETTRIRAEIDTAMNKRSFEEAISLCGQGLSIDKDAKKLMAEMHSRRAKAYAALAKLQLRSPHTAPAAQDGSAVTEDTASTPKALSTASWRRVLQDCNSCLYYEGNSVATILLKCEALQALDKFEEAVSELEAIYSTSLGHDDPQVREKLQQAQRMLKKSKRVNLYDILSLPRGELSTDKEISIAYKKMALKWYITYVLFQTLKYLYASSDLKIVGVPGILIVIAASLWTKKSMPRICLRRLVMRTSYLRILCVRGFMMTAMTGMRSSNRLKCRSNSSSSITEVEVCAGASTVVEGISMVDINITQEEVCILF